LDNILLDSDQEERLFPVIRDFGRVEVLNVSNVVRGFQIINTRVGTLQYSAPENLVGFQNKVGYQMLKQVFFLLD
jgi:serine/threonine protein kinase